MRDTLRVINQMQTDGVIGKYAIGGAVGASLYLEPFTTKDLDIFIHLPVQRETGLVSLSAIHDYLRSKGWQAESQYVLIADWAVEFLPASTDLELDAIEKAVEFTVDDVQTWVMTAEHLAAICLQTGRTKDRYRILAFVEQQAVDVVGLHSLVERFGLQARWQEFERNDLRRTLNPSYRTVKDDRRQYLRRLAPTKKAVVIEELRDAGKILQQARRNKS